MLYKAKSIGLIHEIETQWSDSLESITFTTEHYVSLLKAPILFGNRFLD